ncbi:MAG TPA: hypothetical protein DHV48_03490 [Prolixibacteraceae bacterium]|nr:hypothetical protein [Prolixibacteraceae bacterium]
MSIINIIGISAALFLTMLILGIARWLCVFRFREENGYPTAYEVEKAADEQICNWIKNLEIPVNDSELQVFNLIAERYLTINQIEKV